MATSRTTSARILVPIVTTGVAGTALVSAGLFMDFAIRPASPEVALTTVECSIGDALCDSTDGLVWASGAGGTMSAAATASAVTDIYGFFVGNGTPTHPNAGLLIGDGYSFTADDVNQTPLCTEGSPCNGGNAGLLFGNCRGELLWCAGADQ